MIYDSLQNKERYRHIPKLYEALCYLEQFSEENFPPERRVLGGVVKFLTLRTKPEAEAVFENHRLLGDIHYVIKGVEGIQTADLSHMVPTGEFSEEKDYGEYIGKPDGTYWIRPGYFAVVAPNEVHKTGIMESEPGEVKKIVYKL